MRSTKLTESLIANALRLYGSGFDLLDAYDKGELDTNDGTQPIWSMNVNDAHEVVVLIDKRFNSDQMFAAERDDSLAAILNSIERTSLSEPLHPTVEDRAANLI
jgi:hypothetical protein